jgi:MEMO1 family protein
MYNIRKPNVAGQFYPEKANALKEMIHSFLKESRASVPQQPKAIIAPHAGYIYSGPVAATVYAALSPYKDAIHKVILIGPSHRMYFKGIAATMADYFETPLGAVPVARHRDLSSHVNEAPYAMEHSLEVQLPFLQVVLNQFEIIPLIVGDEEFTKVADVIDSLWGGKETLIVVSSDLSHYQDYQTAQKLDALTSRGIVNFAPEQLHVEQACGLIPIQGLLQAARQYPMQAQALDVRNSGDTAGPKDSVVGYGAYYFW